VEKPTGPRGRFALWFNELPQAPDEYRDNGGANRDASAMPDYLNRESAMPKGKQMKDFGQEFEQLLLRIDAAMRAGADESPIDFANHKLAHSLRFRIYQYFQALRASGDRPDLTAMCSGLSIRVAGSTLVFYRRGEDKESEALRNALGLEKGFADGPTTPGVTVAESALTTYLEELARIRAARGNKP